MRLKTLAAPTERPPFREWLAERISAFAQKKAFNEEREPQTDAEEEELADIVRGIYQRCWILSYKPHKKQDLFHRAARTAQITGSFARNQGGKTTAGEAQILSWGFGEELWSGRPIEKVGRAKWRPGMRFFIGAQDYVNAHNETILPKMGELLPLEEIGVKFVKMQGRITHKLIFPEPYSFTIKLISYDQEEHKQEGPTWNGGWFDEPPPRGIWIATGRGCMKHAAPRLITATPLREPWMYDDIYSAKQAVHVEDESALKHLKWSNIAVIKIGRNDNPHITEEQLAAYEATLDEEEKACRIHGEFKDLQGRVYKNFDREKHVLHQETWLAQHPDWRTYTSFCVMDPHDRKPFALIWGVVTPREEIVVVDEWPEFEFAKQKTWRWTIEEYVNMIHGKEKELFNLGTEGEAAFLGSARPSPVRYRIMDPNFGRTQKAGVGGTVQDSFDDFQLYFDTEVDDDQTSGHMAVRAGFAEQRLFFLSNCNNTIRSHERYTWDEFRGGNERSVKERPRDKWKDFCDVVRYAVKYPVRWIDPSAGNGLMFPPGFTNGGMGRH